MRAIVQPKLSLAVRVKGRIGRTMERPAQAEAAYPVFPNRDSNLKVVDVPE